MALVTSNIQFNGQDTGLLFAESLREGTFIPSADPFIAEGYKSKVNWGILDVEGCLGPYSVCADTNIQDITYQERQQELVRFQANFLVRHDALFATLRETRYRQGQLRGSFLDDSEVQSLLLNTIKTKLGVAANELIVKGSTYYSLANGCVDGGTLDGLLSQFNSNVNVAKVAKGNSTTVSTSTSNGVFQSIEAALDALPANIRFSADPNRSIKLYGAIDVVDAFRKSIHQIGGNSYFIGVTQGGSPQFVASQPYPTAKVRGGMLELVPLQELPSGQFYITWPKNIGVFFDASDDLTNINIVDERVTKNCDQVSMRVNAAMAVALFRPEDIVYAR